MAVYKKTQNGFTLIEAMIAVVVFSFGLLGVAGVMLVAVKGNHNGYMRTQANFLAHSMIDTMRRNSWGVWTGAYNGTYAGYVDVTNVCNTVPAPGDPSATPPTFATGGCGCAAVANRDTQKWTNLIGSTLTNGVGTINCVDTGGPYGNFNCGQADQPYLGLCTITVAWNESNESDSASAQSVTIVSGP